MLDTPANGFVVTIDGIAEQIADLHELYHDLEDAEGPAKEARKNSDVDEEHTALCQTVLRLDRISTIAYARSRALQNVLLQMEPRTLNETLGLALVAYDRIEGNPHDEDLRRAVRAIIRGIVGSGATSPLLDIMITGTDLMPWHDGRILAAADAKRLLKAEERNP
jgi:hypothetical protein